MTKLDAKIEDVLVAASWCDHNGLDELAYAFDGFAMDALPLSSNAKLASIHNCDVTIKTANTSIRNCKKAFIGPDPTEELDPKLLRAMGNAIAGGIPSMNRVAFDMGSIGKGVSNVSDISGLIPGVGAYTRGIGNFIGSLMQGQGVGSALGAGAMGFGLGALPPAVQIGIKGIQTLISYLQGMDLSKMPWLTGILENLQKWLPMIASGVGYALKLGLIGNKEKTPEQAPGQAPEAGGEVLPFQRKQDLQTAMPEESGLPLAAMPIIDKMLKTSEKEDDSWVLFELLNSEKKVYAYGALPKDLYLLAASR